jgi:hypothetical protein
MDKLSRLLEEHCFASIEFQRPLICSLFADPSIDLNTHRELIKQIALFTVNQSDAYQTKMEKKKYIALSSDEVKLLAQALDRPYQNMTELYNALTELKEEFNTEEFPWANSICGACGQNDCYGDCLLYSYYERVLLNPALYPAYPFEEIYKLKSEGKTIGEIIKILNLPIEHS